MANYSLEVERLAIIANNLALATSWAPAGATLLVETDTGDSGADDAVQDAQSWNSAMQRELQQKLQAAANGAAAAAATLSSADDDVAHAAT